MNHNSMNTITTSNALRKAQDGLLFSLLTTHSPLMDAKSASTLDSPSRWPFPYAILDTLTMKVPDSVVVGVEVEFLVGQHLNDQTKKKPASSRWACDPPSKETFKVPSELEKRMLSWPESWALEKSCQVLAKVGLLTACPYPEKHSKGNPILHMGSHKTVHTCEDGKTICVWDTGSGNLNFNSVKTSDFFYVVRERHITSDVKRDAKTAPSSKYLWYGTELNTPIIREPNEFSEGLPTLRKALASLRNDMVLGLNANCGLHIHVSDGGHLSLKTAQRVACLGLFLEDSLLMPLSHPHRHKSFYSMRVSTESAAVLAPERPSWNQLQNDGPTQIKAISDLADKLKAKGHKKVDKRMAKAMMRIYATTSIDQLGKKLRKFNEGSVHTTGRCALAVSAHNSIEFRYPAGTFDVDYVSAWVQLARHIFAIGLTSDDAEFTKILCDVYEAVTRDEHVGWEKMMTKIGFSNVKADEWKKYIKEFGGKLKDLDKQGIAPRA